METSEEERDNLPSECNFRGGFVGFFGYEAWHTLGPAAHSNELKRHRSQVPKEVEKDHVDYSGAEAIWFFADRVIAIDHSKHNEITLLCLCDASKTSDTASAKSTSEQGMDWIHSITQKLKSLAEQSTSCTRHDHPQQSRSQCTPHQRHGIDTCMRFVSDRSKSTYLRDIQSIEGCLRRGDSYEVCLTTTFRSGKFVPPLRTYLALRKMNPAPHAAYLRVDPRRRYEDSEKPYFGKGGVAVCCSSPERFMRVVGPGRRVECKPIKGTSRRGCNDSEDLDLAKRLQYGEKERSENMMIVDLIRNDISRVCDAGSVEVTKLMDVESYSTVHQLVSTVQGTLKQGEDALSAVAAAYPPGSMTGAPKLRTMRIIDELEQGVPRGIYSGCLGFFSVSGACDLNVVIRTCVHDCSSVTVGAGGAIVALSDKDDEYEEVLLKARPIMRALAACACGDADRFTIEN